MTKRVAASMLVVALATCRAADDPATSSTRQPTATPRPADSAAQPFLRVPIEIVASLRAADIVIPTRPPRGEVVGADNSGALGLFACRLVARFGDPDHDVYVRRGAARAHAYALRHVASDTLIIPYLGAGANWGYGGAVLLHADGRFERNDEWGFFPPSFRAAAEELDELLAATTPVDCALTYASGMLASEVGIRGGKPFWRHLAPLEHLAFRMAELDDFDARNVRDPRLERELCDLAVNAWHDAHDQRASLAAHVHARDRLRRCLEQRLEDILGEPPGDSELFDGWIAEAAALDAPELVARFRAARARR